MAAADDKLIFTIAPPPVGYPEFVSGSKELGLGVSFMAISLPFTYIEYEIVNNLPEIHQLDKELKLKGGAVTFNEKAVSGNLAFGQSGGLAVLAGNINKSLLLSVNYRLSGIWQMAKTKRMTSLLFAGAGLEVTQNYSKIDIPQYMPFITDPVIDEVSSIFSLLSGNVSGGLQMNVQTGDFIISPFSVYTHSMAKYISTMTSSMSFDYPSEDGQVPAFNSLVLGFDIVYTPRRIALSSMFQKTKKADIINISLRKSFDLGVALK
jgi:hypothetical protein